MALGIGTWMIHELAQWMGTDLVGKSPKMILLSSLTLLVWNLLEKSCSRGELPPGSDSQLPASWRSDPLKYYFSTPRAWHVPDRISPTQINTWGRSSRCSGSSRPAACADRCGKSLIIAIQTLLSPPVPQPAQTITFTCSMIVAVLTGCPASPATSQGPFSSS